MNDLPLMAERSRSGGAVPCPSSNVDCRSPLPKTALLSVGPRRTPGNQHITRMLYTQVRKWATSLDNAAFF